MAIWYIDCAGMRLQESVDALDGFGRIYAKEIEASGVIPQISAVFGNCGGGLAVVPALSDFAFMEATKAKMFINSPNAIEGNRIEKCDTSAAKFQSEETGCVDYAGTEDEILTQIRELVSMLPLNNEGDVYTEECEDDLNRACASMDVMKGDARYLLSEISDGHAFFETKADYAKNMVTGFIKLNGMTVGAVANCTEIHDEEGKTAETFEAALTVKGCEKASEFIRFCDAFEIPVLSITNVTGFKACMCAEKGLAKALELATENLDENIEHAKKMRNRLIEGIRKNIPYCRLNGPEDEGRLCNNVNFSFQYVEGESILMMLDMKGVAASSGSACASGSLDPSHVLIAIGLPHEIAHGSLRLSVGDETTEEDVDYVVEVLPPIIQRLRDMSPLYEGVEKGDN